MDSSSCYSEGLNHAMVLVGFDIRGSSPFWILRNSWGPDWGENGYLRLSITGGSGTCGINVFPAYYPVLQRGQ